MTTNDLIKKSIENLILYGIDLGINEEDYNEYLFQMEKYFNSESEVLIATLDIDALVIDTVDGDHICNLFIKDSVLHIVPTSNEHTFNVIIMMLEFITSNTELFDKTHTEELEEDSDDDFEWI